MCCMKSMKNNDKILHTCIIKKNYSMKNDTHKYTYKSIGSKGK